MKKSIIHSCARFAYIELEIYAGTELRDAYEFAIRTLAYHNCPVRFNFNEVDCLVTPTDFSWERFSRDYYRTIENVVKEANKGGE